MSASPIEAIDPEVIRLVDLAKQGDRGAFASLYDRYVDQVYGYIRRRVGQREVAEDLTGDVFLRAWRRFEQFEWQGVDLGAWLMTIARNRVNDHFKSSRFRLERSTAEFLDRPEGNGADDPERITVGRDMARSLGAALERLRDDHREVIELRFIHDLGVAETADVLGRTIGATKALQYRALRALATLVKDEPGFDTVLAAGLTGLVTMLRMLS